MRGAMLTILVAMFTTVALALAQDSDRVPDKADPKSVAPAKVAAPEEFKLPPGFKERKHGKITVYCIKGKATGTRFPTESCYDKAQLEDYLLAREQNNRDFDRARATCSSVAACGSQ